jgi:hypothetical protein
MAIVGAENAPVRAWELGGNLVKAPLVEGLEETTLCSGGGVECPLYFSNSQLIRFHFNTTLDYCI